MAMSPVVVDRNPIIFIALFVIFGVSLFSLAILDRYGKLHIGSPSNRPGTTSAAPRTLAGNSQAVNLSMVRG